MWSPAHAHAHTHTHTHTHTHYSTWGSIPHHLNRKHKIKSVLCSSGSKIIIIHLVNQYSFITFVTLVEILLTWQQYHDGLLRSKLHPPVVMRDGLLRSKLHPPWLGEVVCSVDEHPADPPDGEPPLVPGQREDEAGQAGVGAE